MNSSSPPIIDSDSSRMFVGLLRLSIILALTLIFHVLFLIYVTIPRTGAADFWSFYTAARIPLTGRSPYEPNVLDANHPVYRGEAPSYFRWIGWKELKGPRYKALGQPFPLYYPPQFYLLFTPFSRLRWQPALVAWLGLLTIICLACGTLSWSFNSTSKPTSAATQVLVAVVLLLDPIMMNSIASAQSTLLLCGGVVLGRLALLKGHHWLASLLWSLCAVKPQAGFELIALSVLVGGWIFSVRIGLWIVGLNLVGGLVMSGDPLLMRGMMAVGAVYLTFPYNSVISPELVGWNRILYVFGGPAVEMLPITILASHLAWMALIVSSCWLRSRFRWSLSYWLAAASIGSIECSLSHHYDLVLLVLVVPYLFWLWDGNYKRDVAFLLCMLALLSLPKAICFPLVKGLHLNSPWTEALLSYRAFLILGLAAYLLIRGEPDARGQRSSISGPSEA